MSFSDELYRFQWEPENVSMVMERLAEKRNGGIGCELTIETTAPPSPGLLYSGNFNLLTNNAALANKLDRRVDQDWDALLTQAAGIAKTQWREGDPPVDLAHVAPSDSTFLLQPFIVDLAGAASVIFADGGTGKSLFALACALSVATGHAVLGNYPDRTCPVLYLDWEADAATHAERLAALCAGLADPIERPEGVIHHQQMVASLHEAAPAVRKQVVRLGIGLVIVDSIGMARGGAPESAEDTIRLFTALRSLLVPVLGVDHISKETARQKGGSKSPIGSVYTANSARNIWGMQKNQEEDAVEMQVALSNYKANNGRRQRPRGYKVEFLEDEYERLVEVRIDATDIRDMPTLYEPSRKNQIATAIQQNSGLPMSVKEIVDSLGDISEQRVRGVLHDHEEFFVRVEGTVRAGKWALATEEVRL